MPASTIIEPPKQIKDLTEKYRNRSSLSRATAAFKTSAARQARPHQRQDLASPRALQPYAQRATQELREKVKELNRLVAQQNLLVRRCRFSYGTSACNATDSAYVEKERGPIKWREALLAGLRWCSEHDASDLKALTSVNKSLIETS